MYKKTQVNIVTQIDQANYNHIIYEITTEESIMRLFEFWFTESGIAAIRANIAKKDDRKKSMVFYGLIANIESIVIFFPSLDTLMDDRCDFFRTIETNSLFVPDSESAWAYEALRLATYRYQDYLTKKKEYTFAIQVDVDQKDEIASKAPLYDAIISARDIINMPPQDATPTKITQDILQKKWNHFTVEVLEKNELEKHGCNLLLAVGAGSIHPPSMVILRPKNPPKTEKYALIGKGVTFDAGWIQIKPDTAMVDMKCDMSGAAGVLGVAQYLDTLSTLPVDVTIAVGLTENMTGDAAFKPLDIYTSYTGVTVEIHHTDAEWRLVLADVMWYVEKNDKPQHIITMATLTGACIHALGNDIAGIMWDDEEVISTLIDTTSPYEKVWRLPLTPKMKKSLQADIADLKNLTRTEKAWSSVGGAFLTYFQWEAKLTHLDIAWPAYRESPYGYMSKWGTGWWVKMLSEMLISKGWKTE